MLKLIFKNFKYRLLSEMSFKADFLGELFVTISINIFTICLFKVIFSYSRNFGFWSFDDFFLASLFYMSFRLFVECLDDNMFEFFETVFEGKFDSYLCKPINLLFFVLFYFFRVTKLIIAVVIYFMLIFYILYNNIVTNFSDIILFFVSSFISITIGILFTFIMVSLNLFSQKNLYIGFHMHHFSQLCYLPPTIFSQNLFKILFITVPYMFISSLPVLILKYKQYNLITLSIIPLLILFFIAYLFWKKYKTLLKSFGG
ncbi:ABC-2 family transporter protein [Pigmentibacter ruber]|uniref:ABC-2 family transporter protein n=1 Tax=Pigmentibacter ruber TaxID=2683196 RepID=UPI00131E0027|nr:ABC-2 family transporter protein [Pigmentibacter ruber]BFD30989.1 hypothetical protein GTC16762_06070 [Pigmentibacter ruber]